MTLNLNLSTFIPNNPKLAAVALLAPIGLNAAINIFQGYDLKKSCVAASYASSVGFSQAALYYRGIESLRNPIFYVMQSVLCAATYCLYKAMETKSPYFIIPAALLGAIQIIWSSEAVKEV